MVESGAKRKECDSARRDSIEVEVSISFCIPWLLHTSWVNVNVAHKNMGKGLQKH